MIKIGIDFSINSTALVINDSNKFLFYSFVPNFKSTLKGSKWHNELQERDLVKIISYEKNSNDKDPIKDQQIKLLNADRLSDKILEEVLKFKDIELEIRIEGYSYGSAGSSFIDLIAFNTFLKVKLIKEFGVESIKVIPPKTNKKLYTGNGNANKCAMLKKFITEEILLAEFIKEKDIIKEEEFQIPKPIDDLVDAFALSVVKV